MRPLKSARIRRNIISLLLISLLLPTMGWAAPAHSHSKNTLLQRKATLQSKIGRVRQKINQVRSKVHQTRSELSRVEHNLRIARGQYQLASVRYDRARIELARAKTTLRDAKSEYADTRDQAGSRLVAMYERGEPGYLEMVLTSTDTSNFLQRSQLARLSMEQDRDTLTELHTRKDRITQYENQVAQKTREVAIWRAQAEMVHARTVQQRTTVAKTLTSTQQEASDLEAELASLERDSSAVTAMLSKMASTPAGIRRFHTHYSGPVSGLPVNGRITSPFGWRYHPVLHYARLHTGVDIAAPTGTPIYAVGGGEVVSAGWRGGYGNAVVIDHGGGRATLYGHMSRILVHAGQVLVGRQIIGLVGMTGLATGPHVHFELRINGTPVNPL